MKFRAIFIILFLTTWSFVECQTPFVIGEITDNRDGKIYQTIKIENATWLVENMKFKTENADTIVKNDQGLIMDGYYYPVEESDKVCPNEFRIPKISDWEKYVQVLLKLKNIPDTSIVYYDFTHKRGKGGGRSMKKPNDKLQFFQTPNPLNLNKSGLVQGRKFISDNGMNFWTRNSDSMDFKYHLHLQPNYFWNHTHKHHIIAKKKKKRKFVVRCVKNDSTEKKEDKKE